MALVVESWGSWGSEAIEHFRRLAHHTLGGSPATFKESPGYTVIFNELLSRWGRKLSYSFQQGLGSLLSKRIRRVLQGSGGERGRIQAGPLYI